MGNNIPARQTFDKINKLVESSRYNEAFLLLKKYLPQFPTSKAILSKLNQVEMTYRYMLDYIAEGHDDPSRNEMMLQIKETLISANEWFLRETVLKDSSDIYSSNQRMFSLKQTSLSSLMENFYQVLSDTYKENPEESHRVITISQATLINEIFNYVWTLYASESSEYEILNSIFEESKVPEYLKSLLVSAIILGNVSYFNPDTFEILLNQYESADSIDVRAKSAVGIILLSLLYSKRIEGNLKLRSRLMLLAEDEEWKKLVSEVLINILKTYDTKRIDAKMRNEVIPGLMKIKPEIIDKIRNLASDSDNFLSEGNPEWEEIIENSDIGNKLKEITDMQLEGADVMVTAFSNLKGFPFFSQVSNWFLPFTPGHYEFAAFPIDKDEKTVSRLTTVMCDSDLHSFLLSLSSMPEDKRSFMLSNMQSQMKEAYEAMSSAVGETDSQRLSKKIRHSLQDLYRFFKFYRKKNDFKDPFSQPFLSSHIEPLMPIYGIELENLKLMAEFYFKNKYYSESVGFFEFIDNLEPGNFSIWEKTGFAYDRLQQYDKAVEWYSKADLINPGNPWLEKKLAIALKNSGNPKKALEYYEKSLKNDPENYHLLMSAGQCLLACEKPQEALKHFYHAQYLKPDKLSPLRAVAWAELLSGNHEKAISQYEKILQSSESDKSDLLNMAHTYLAGKDFKNGLKAYKSFVEKSDNNEITSLVIALRDDSETLKKLGIKTSDLRLIVDKIRYDFTS